jgi:hypothetical protein
MIIVTCIISACAPLPPTSSTDNDPLPGVDSIVIISNGPTNELKARFNRDSTINGMKVGAGAGATGGAAAALACGPFYFLCAMGTIPAGMFVGAVGGSAVGATSDASKKPTEEQLLTLEKQLAEISQSRVIYKEIETALEQKIPPARIADEGTAQATFVLSLSDVRFVRGKNDEFTLTLTIFLKARWNDGKRKGRFTIRTYSYTTRSKPISEWIEGDGKTLNLALNSCVKGLANDVFLDIVFNN